MWWGLSKGPTLDDQGRLPEEMACKLSFKAVMYKPYITCLWAISKTYREFITNSWIWSGSQPVAPVGNHYICVTLWCSSFSSGCSSSMFWLLDPPFSYDMWELLRVLSWCLIPPLLTLYPPSRQDDYVGKSWFMPTMGQLIPINYFWDPFAQNFYHIWVIIMWSPYSQSPELGKKLQWRSPWCER